MENRKHIQKVYTKFVKSKNKTTKILGSSHDYDKIYHRFFWNKISYIF